MTSRMRSVLMLPVLALCLAGCKLGGSASGLQGDITLQEVHSQEVLTINSDGAFRFQHAFKPGNPYEVVIIDAEPQTCSVSNGSGLFKSASIDTVRVDCDGTICTSDYNPVCAKVATPVVCIQAPCDTHRYETFSNACFATAASADISFAGECDKLQNLMRPEDDPVMMDAILLDNMPSRPVTIVKADIRDGVAHLSLQYSGGCGEHHFDLHVAQQFTPGDPARAYLKLVHESSDSCQSTITSEKTFDLVPVREFFRRQFGTTDGSVNLPGIGVYELE